MCTLGNEWLSTFCGKFISALWLLLATGHDTWIRHKKLKVQSVVASKQHISCQAMCYLINPVLTVN